MASRTGRLSAKAQRTVVDEAERASRGGVLHRIAYLAIAAPRRMLVVAALVAVAAGIFGVPVAKSLCACGFEDPASESAKAQQLLTDKFHVGDVQLVIVVSAPGGANGSAASTVGTDLVDDLKASPHVTSVTSLWTAPPPSGRHWSAATVAPASSSPGSRARRTRLRNTPRTCRTDWSTTGTA